MSAILDGHLLQTSASSVSPFLDSLRREQRHHRAVCPDKGAAFALNGLEASRERDYSSSVTWK